MTKVTSFVLGYQTQGGHTPTTPCYGKYFMIVYIVPRQQLQFYHKNRVKSTNVIDKKKKLIYNDSVIALTGSSTK